MRQARKVESLDEAEERILALKLDDSEKALVKRVFEMWRAGTIETPKARLSKKSVVEAYEAWRQAERERKKRWVVEHRPVNCLIVTDVVTMERVRALVLGEPVIACDTETDGLDLFNNRIVGFSAYLPNADVQFYVPFGHTTGEAQVSREDALALLGSCVHNRKTVWHNYKFDAHMCMNEGIVPDAPWWDTLTAMKILNNNEPAYGLKPLYTKYCDKTGGETITFEDLFDDAVIYDKPIELAGIYAAGDSYKTYKLYEFEKPHIDTRDRLRIVWYEIEQKLLHIDALTERNGVNVDLTLLATLHDELTPKVAEAAAKVREAFNLDDSFNFASPQQLAHLVYDVAGADPTFPRRFRKADRSTAAEVLDALCDELPQLEPLLVYRTYEKLLGTYVDKIPGAMEPATGRLHFSLNSTDTDTGRYASRGYGNKSNPKGCNIQNIPVRIPEGKRVRKAFVPAPGNVFIGADLSQIEPRIIAHILYSEFNDPSMKRIYDEGVDLYTTMAMRTFNLDQSYCVDKALDPTGSFEPRRLMKTGVLAYLYGQTPKAFARKMSVTDEVATTFFEGMSAAFPGLAPFRGSIISDLLTKGNVAYAETLDGRKRRFPDYRTRYGELKRIEALPYRSRTQAQTDRMWELRRYVSGVQRQAVNTRVQGSAADVIKRNIIAVHERIVWPRKWRYIASIHDEIWVEAPLSDVTPETVALVNECMTRTVALSVPLKADVVIEPRWMDEYKPSDWDYEKGAPKSKEVDCNE